MDDPTSMVAVVQGLPESALAVTLLDGNRQYTLMPNNYVPQPCYVHDSQKPIQHASKYQDQFSSNCNSGVQAVDGRYASVYQVAHCNVQPTSPPLQLTEFPPQRAELSEGLGNFEVGGSGSGQTKHSPVRANGSFRGGLNWSDRGTVFSPKPSHEPGAFANSLRKYPQMSPERAAEVMERLINYAQAKNSHKSPLSRSPPSESLPGSQACGKRSCITSIRSQRLCEPKACSYTVSPCLKESRYHSSSKIPKVPVDRTNSVNMETQADVPMVSKEVATVPRKQPATHNVAVPQCLPSSFSKSLQLQPNRESKYECKSIQTSEALDLTLNIRRSVQTCISSIGLPQEKKKNVENGRKSKSQEEIRTKGSHDDYLHEKVIQLIKDLSMCHQTDSNCDLRNRLLRKLEKLLKTDNIDIVNIKLGKCIRDQLYSHVNFKKCSKEFSNNLISEIKSHNVFVSDHSSSNVFKVETDLIRNSKEVNIVDELVTEWINQIPIKQKDYSGRTVKKADILHAVAEKIKSLIKNKGFKYNYGSLKLEIFDILGYVPIEVNAHNKKQYLKDIIHDLVNIIENITTNNSADKKRCEKAVLKHNIEITQKNSLRAQTYLLTHVQPTEEELKTFVKKEIKDFISNFSIKLCPDTQSELQVELTDILIDSIEAVRYGNNEQVKAEILVALSELINVSQHEATYFANNLILNIKHIFKETLVGRNSQNLFFIQDTDQHPSSQSQNNATDISIEKITDHDMQNYLDLYSQQIVQEVTEWMRSIQGLTKVNADSLQVAANGLTADIVDRHKYLEQNPSSKRTELGETEHLKNLINKWVIKLVDKKNSEPIKAVSKLMQRIQKIPAPMLSRPVQNIDTCQPDQCQQSSCSRKNSAQGANSSTASTRRRLSSQAAVFTGAVKSCSANCKNKENGSSLKNSIDATSETKRVSFTQSTSTSSVKPTRELSRNGRFSGQDSFLSGQAPLAGPSYGHPDASSTLKRLSSPEKANQPNDLKNNAGTMTTKKLNDEYDEYLKDWVQQIPIASSNPEEAALAEKLRLGIYNGIWKAIIKIKMNPTALNNAFYYQDVLDEEIEDLLGLLPQIPELVGKKQMLKCKLLEKTTDMNEQIKNTVAPSSFKENIIQNISNNLDGQYIDPTDRNIHKACEELHKLNLAENFILFTGYKEIDNVKANVYKRKVLKRIQELYDDLKRVHGKGMIESDFGAFQNEIINSLFKVPLPNDNILKEEADEILIGLEIDHWFSDLPLHPASNRVEELSRLRNRDILANKIHDMEKQSSLPNCEDELRQEIIRFMSRLALTEEEAKNTPFMVEELVNRLKNRQTDIVAGSVLPKQPYFAHPDDYDDFCRNTNFCSSFADVPVDKRAPSDSRDRSFYVIGGERVEEANFPFKDLDAYRRLQEIPSDQFHTIMDSPIQPSHPSKHPCSNSRAPDHQISVRQTDNGPGMQSYLQDSGGLMRNPPQHFIPSQPRAPPRVRDETIGGQVPPDLSFRDPVADVRALQRSLRQSPQASRFPDANICDGFAEERTVPDQRSPRLTGPRGFSETIHGDPGISGGLPRQRALSNQRCTWSRGPGGNQTDPVMSSSFPRQRIISDQMSPSCKRPEGFQEIPRTFGGFPGQRTGTEQRLSGFIGSGGFQEEPYISSGFPGQRNLPNQRSGTIMEDPRYRSPIFSPAPTAYAPESSARPYETAGYGPEYARPFETGQATPHSPFQSERPHLATAGAFSRQSMDFSTPPHQNVPPYPESRPNKRTREINRSRRDKAKKRLDLEDSNDSGPEMRCRCMDRIWNCRRRPPSCSFDDYDMDFPRCFPMGYPYPCYF